MFCHDAVLDYILCGNTRISANELKRRVRHLEIVDRSSRLTGFENELLVSKNQNAVTILHMFCRHWTKLVRTEKTLLTLATKKCPLKIAILIVCLVGNVTLIKIERFYFLFDFS